MATMPSVSNSASNSTISTSKEAMEINPAPAETPLGQAVQMIEKKVRNLEKRKSKLDGYRAELKRGKELNEDQKLAISKYDEVIQSLDFARELTSQFKALSLEEDKNRKKLQKKEQVEKAKTESQRLAQILEIQDFLQLFAKSKVRNDFSNGENGATQLTKDQLAMLDEFTKAISRKTSTGNDYEKTVTNAAENFFNALEGKQSKKFGHGTFKDLKSLFETIKASGYLQAHSHQLDEEDEKPVGGKGRGGKKSHHNGDKKDSGEKSGHGSPSNNTSGPVKQQQQQPPRVEPVAPSQLPQPQFSDMPQQQQQPQPQQPQNREPAFIHPSAVTAPSPPQHQQPTPPQQPHVDFFQDSQIDMESPHMDPAVVMVHSSAPPHQQQQHHHHMMLQEQQQPNIPTQSFNSQMYAPPTTLAAMHHQQHDRMMYSGQQQPQHHSPQPIQQEQYDYHQEELSKRMGQVGLNNNAQSSNLAESTNNFDDRPQQQQPVDTFASIDDWDNEQATGNGEDRGNGVWRPRPARSGGNGRGRGDGFRGDRRGGYRGGREQREGGDHDNNGYRGDRGSGNYRGGRGGERGGPPRQGGERSTGPRGDYRGGRGGNGGAQSSRTPPRGAPGRSNGYHQE